jgi:hypothetical protein
VAFSRGVVPRSDNATKKQFSSLKLGFREIRLDVGPLSLQVLRRRGRCGGRHGAFLVAGAGFGPATRGPFPGARPHRF